MNSTGENPGELITENDLAAIAEKYPYFAPGQFRLLSGYKKNNHPRLNRQAAIALLFFKNNKWLNWQLTQQQSDKRVENEITGIENEILQEPVADITEPIEKKEELIAFEPLHTIDYFASQGIKVSEDAAADKLGIQLKSFTEWLKGMKKIHAQTIPKGDEQTDRMIQHIAESSNVKIDVDTEAMAEVLLNQGKTEQAIEIYNKLSLNNPSESGYFAAKINSLKKHLVC